MATTIVCDGNGITKCTGVRAPFGSGGAGSILAIGGGDGTAPGVNLAGDTQVLQGQVVAGLSAKLDFMGGAAGVSSICRMGTYILSNRFNIDSIAASSLLRMNGPNGFELQAGGANIIDVGSNATGEVVFSSGQNVWFNSALATPKLGQLPRTSDLTPVNITISPQQPFATATGANRKPGNLIDALGTPTNSGTIYAKRSVTWGTKDRYDIEDGHVQTVDATANVVVGVITLAAGDTVCGFVLIKGHEAATGDSFTASIAFGADQAAGTAAGLGTPVLIFAGSDAGAATWVANLDVSGATVRTVVTGQVGKTIEWSVKWNIGGMAL